MIDVFTLKLFLSFIVGGVYAILATYASDKFGAKIGGLIGGLPSTVLFGILFIAWTQNTNASIESMTLIPAVIGIACFFLVTYVIFAKRNIWFALAMAYVVWFVFAFILLAIPHISFIASIIIFIICFIITYLFITKGYAIKTVKGKAVVYTPKLVLLRGLLTGTVVALSVFLAKVGGPVIGGIFTTFPTLFPSILLLAYFSHGADFTLSVAKSSLFAWISTTIFVIVARYTVLPFGIVMGMVVSLAISYLSAYVLYRYVIKKHA